MENFITAYTIDNREVLINIEKIVDARNFNGLIGIFLEDDTKYIVYGDFDLLIEILEENKHEIKKI